MNGHMAEAQEGYVVPSDVDEETLVRFAEWTYTGYYNPADHSVAQGKDDVGNKIAAPATNKSVADESPSPSPPNFDMARPLFGTSGTSGTSIWGPTSYKQNSKKQKRGNVWEEPPHEFSPARATSKSSKDKIKESFISRKSTTRQEHIAVPPTRPNKRPDEDYTEVFLSHAKLHVFADKYDIQTLKMLSLENLQLTLAVFTLYEERTGDITALLRYIYDCAQILPGMDEMRGLMIEYMAFEMETLMKDQGFKDLMEHRRDLIEDFMKVVQKRI